MKCQNCGSCDNKVVESRDVADGEAVRRRRECLKCGYRFTTYERLERPALAVVKRDGTRELFSRDKLLDGLLHAAEKTSLTSVQLENFVADIERQLYDKGEPEVKSSDIGELVMAGLPGLNEVAYVRFASVYRKFRDISGFERELSRMRGEQVEAGKAKTKTAKARAK